VGQLVRPLKADKQGRPRLEITDAGWQMVERMANALCPLDEIADMLGISTKTLQAEQNRERLDRILKSKAAHVRLMVRESQLEKALNGNPVNGIWWTKNNLGWTDRQAITNGQGGPLELVLAGMDKLEDLLDKLDKRKANAKDSA
jgi:hypothetical protein